MKVLPWPSALARQPNFAAKQAGDFAADGQAQPGAAIFAARAAVGLLESLEDNLLFLGSDADPGVRDGEGNNGAGMVENFVFWIPTFGNRGNVQGYAAALAELERVGQQIAQDLFQPL